MIYARIVRPALFRLWPDAEDAHEATMQWLERLAGQRLLCRSLRRVLRADIQGSRRTIWGLEFSNAIGLAGGFDKNARAVAAWHALGFGHVEVGTVTNLPQPGNERPRAFRLPRSQAIVNRFGFNNEGAEAVASRLERAFNRGTRPLPVGISLGKSKATALEDAVEDYLTSLRAVYTYGDYFAVNVSSPNTPGLRTLQERGALGELLGALDAEARRLHAGAAGTAWAAARGRKPLLVKVSPDLADGALDELLEECVARGVDGLIATNTTLGRDGIDGREGAAAKVAGGLSGAPLHVRSLQVVARISRALPAMPVVGVGGVMDGDGARRMLDAGADLVQVYTGFVYGGPLFPARLARATRGAGRGRCIPPSDG